MKNLLLVLYILLAFLQNTYSQTLKPNHSPVYYFGQEAIWFDEFNENGTPDSTKWTFQTGGNGFGNNELQYYTDEDKNAWINDGNLIIEARKETVAKNQYSSAKLNTKHSFQYGKFEIRAKLPKGTGSWPAIWMLFTDKKYGKQGWPDNGEIDIMEHVGFDQNRVHGNIHTKAFNHVIQTNKGNSILVSDASEAFHIYGCEWTPEKIKISVDGNTYFEFTKEVGFTWQEWPFDQPFHLILNVAVGGNWGGQKGVDDHIFPQRMLIDYVRIFPMIESE